MMNLDTQYLNLNLRSPLVVSASPLSQSLDNIKRMEDAGAGAVVLYSLLEEQLRLEQKLADYFKTHPTATPADALALFPAQFHAGLNDYLNHIRKCKETVAIPILASLNCNSLGPWSEVAQSIEAAGADALELNIYHVAADFEQTAEQIEGLYRTILKMVKAAIKIPVAVKLSPYFTNLAHVARQLDYAGADALVLFNRFYQPDFDPNTLSLKSDIPFGTSSDFRLTLHWVSILYGYVKPHLAATGGIYTARDVVALLMVGARVTMLASALLSEGIDHLRVLEQDLRQWLDQNDYSSVAQLQGMMKQFHRQDTSAFERAEYIRTIQRD
jgi:dihydroorotate dehydrogenase (fumarate)